MGDPKRPKKRYETPSQRWNKTRIEQEKILMKEYGLKNKQELWKMQSLLRRFTTQAKKLTGQKGKQRELEEKQLMQKLAKLNLFPKIEPIENVLNLTLKDVLNRRLQTLVYKKELALSTKQARQFIAHGHICIGEKKINVPSYLVTKDEESKITYKPLSILTKKDHPEIIKLKKPRKVKTDLKESPNENKFKKDTRKFKKDTRKNATKSKTAKRR